jgi:sec-independent protein translocase protein TatA
MGQTGFQELIIIGIIALMIFGPKKLPELGSGLGKAIQNFKSGLRESVANADERGKQGP